MSPPVGVLVMAHGTPDSPDGIASFYTRIRRGRPPTPAQLDELVQRYAAIGGVSPLTERTQAQVDGIRNALDRRTPGRYVVAFGAKHTAPFIEDGAAALVAAGAACVIGLVLTPHGSLMGSQEYVERAQASLGPRFVAVPPWFSQPAFVDLVATRVTEAREPFGDRRVPVVFTAHSLPERVREMGDTYPEQLAESARLVAEAAGVNEWRVAWQSAGRTPEPWLGPDIRHVVRQLADEGARALVVCPIGFVADHLEVLYDLDIELAAVAAECALPWARTASLNDDARFIDLLADVVMATDRADA
jgi:ferrochelatase